MQIEKPILFFDGGCHLCDRIVDFLLKWDPQGRLNFAPLQGQTAEKILTPQERGNLNSLILWENQKKSTHSTAAIRVFIILGGGFRILGVLYLIPKPLRDTTYSWLAKNRHRWFGKKNSCRQPLPHEKNRLLP